MSNDDDDAGIISKEGFLQTKLFGQPKWRRRYCIIDWDKALLFVASKADRQYGDYIKLLPNISVIDSEVPSDYTIEINADKQSHFVLTESKIEHDCWLIALKRTAYSRFGGGIFGQSLEDTYRYACDKTSLVPSIVRQCCEFLLEHGTTFVGLFRVPGKQSCIRELRDKYDRCQPVELDSSQSPATIASLLKIYLQSLPEPIIPMKRFDDFLEIGSRFKYSQTNDLDNLKRLIETSLSPVSYALLAYLCSFIKKLTEYAHDTKMDTENFAITFGSNLIRAPEELDMNMIKGHSYNLIPLIRALIDYSNCLFTMNVNELYEEQQESGEKHNESIRKSSGFSSFSSLLSSNEHPILTRTRSSSLPSIPFAVSSLVDSANFSFDGRSGNYSAQYRSQSSATCIQADHSIHEEKDENSINEVEPRLTNSMTAEDEEATKEQSTNKEQKRKSVISWQFGSKSNTSLPAVKTTKKSFADKFGKSISTFKTNMSKAFIPYVNGPDNVPHANTLDGSSSRSSGAHDQRRSVDFGLSDNYLKVLHDEICVLKGIIDKRNATIDQLTKTSDEERLRYEKENSLLEEQIKQLQLENSQLKASDQPDN